MPKRFVLLDRDGTLVVERNYLTDPDEIELLPGAISGLKKMAALGFGLVVITNQSAIGRGWLSHERLGLIHARMQWLLSQEGLALNGIFACPHVPEAGCECRKPQPGLALFAARELGFKLEDSFIVGDKACDIDLGRNIGAQTCLVRTGYGRAYGVNSTRPDLIARDLDEAADLIARHCQPV